jgi:hypothetical protein
MPPRRVDLQSRIRENLKGSGAIHRILSTEGRLGIVERQPGQVVIESRTLVSGAGGGGLGGDTLDAAYNLGRDVGVDLGPIILTTASLLPALRYSDNAKEEFGTGADVGIWFDGTHLIVDPRQVGSGNLKIWGAGDIIFYSDDGITTKLIIKQEDGQIGIGGVPSSTAANKHQALVVPTGPETNIIGLRIAGASQTADLNSIFYAAQTIIENQNTINPMVAMAIHDFDLGHASGQTLDEMWVMHGAIGSKVGGVGALTIAGWFEALGVESGFTTNWAGAKPATLNFAKVDDIGHADIPEVVLFELAKQSGVSAIAFRCRNPIVLDDNTYMRFEEAEANGDSAVELIGPASVASDKRWTLPATDVTNGRLKSDGSGVISLVEEITDITFVIDGGGSAITTGQKGHLAIDFACTILGWTILGDQSGSIVVDCWKDTYASFPPTVADTIAGSEKPTLSAAQKNQDLTLSTWTTAVAAGDILAFNVDSAATVTRVTIALKVRKT